MHSDQHDSSEAVPATRVARRAMARRRRRGPLRWLLLVIGGVVACMVALTLEAIRPPADGMTQSLVTVTTGQVVVAKAHPAPARRPPAKPPAAKPPPSQPGVAPRVGGVDDLHGLTPGTRRAYLAAQRDARADGIQMRLTSGYRTPAEQQRLWLEAIRRYGSEQAARHWVLPPSESEHVKGIALDVRPPEAAVWLQRQGIRYGLCQHYRWEWWHFEYRPEWIQAGRCPAPLQ